MAFEKTLTAANSEKFAVTEGGFLLTEEQMTAIEAALSDANAKIGTSEECISSLKTAATASANTIKNLGDDIATLKGEKETLQTRIQELEGSAEEFTSTSRKSDPDAGKGDPEFLTSFDREALRMKAMIGE